MSAPWADPLADFGALLAYPAAGVPAEALRRLEAEAPEAARALAPFAAFAAERPAAELEEAYTRVFDLDPSCALELGWHLYGEDYARGAFLVEMRRLMRRLGVAEDGELPDHLLRVLTVLGRLGPEESGALAREKVLPALAKMRAAAGEDPYAAVLRALETFLMSRCGEAPRPAAAAEGGKS